jgi:hypothetical protein
VGRRLMILYTGIAFAGFVLGPSASGAPQTRAAPPCAGQWVIQPSQNPGFSDSLSGVAATSSTDVWAVGSRGSRQGNLTTLAQHWDGVAWSLVPTLNPSSDQDWFSAVAATSPNDVWAVGTQVTGSVLTTLVEHWDGTAWSVSPSQNPSSTDNQLEGVSALSPTDVWAVGVAIVGVEGTLTEHWDGTSWTVVPSPNESQLNILSSVSMVSSGDVWAVGSFETDTGGANTLILNWDGTAWNVVGNPTLIASFLLGVAANGANDVWAVGGDSGGSFVQSRAEHWDGATWTQVHTPQGRGAGILSDVAFASAGRGWSVGFESHPSGDASIVIQIWNGSSWITQPGQSPGLHVNQLMGVTALAPGTAWAVGNYDNLHNQSRTLIETITC